MAKLDTEVRKALGLTPRAQPQSSASGPTNECDEPRHYDAERAAGGGEGAGGSQALKL